MARLAGNFEIADCDCACGFRWRAAVSGEIFLWKPQVAQVIAKMTLFQCPVCYQKGRGQVYPSNAELTDEKFTVLGA
jgi:hypothetical protein